MCLCGDTECPSCGCLQGTLPVIAVCGTECCNSVDFRAATVEHVTEHRFLCHSDGSECKDGCDAGPLKPVVKLSGQDGNAFNILGLCQRAARKAQMSKEQLEVFMKEAMSGDYDHLLQTAMKYFEVR